MHGLPACVILSQTVCNFCTFCQGKLRHYN